MGTHHPRLHPRLNKADAPRDEFLLWRQLQLIRHVTVAKIVVLVHLAHATGNRQQATGNT